MSGPADTIGYDDSALVVLGHGTELNAQSAAPVFQHAAELRARHIFREVREAFWKQEPQIKRVLAGISAPRVFIAPLFISEGYFAGHAIPAELGFGAGRILRTPTSTLHYCQPVGTHDSMTNVILARAAGVVRQYPFPRAPEPAATTLFIAGHGTEKNPNSSRAIHLHAERIRARKIYADAQAVFLEEEPRIARCYERANTRYCVVAPFFISDGLHVAEDIPVLLGEPERVVQARRAAGQPTWRNPTEIAGKLIWYSASVGTEPALADVLLERVAEAAGASVREWGAGAGGPGGAA